MRPLTCYNTGIASIADAQSDSVLRDCFVLECRYLGQIHIGLFTLGSKHTYVHWEWDKKNTLMKINHSETAALVNSAVTSQCTINTVGNRPGISSLKGQGHFHFAKGTSIAIS